MDSNEYRDWFIIRVNCGQDGCAVAALTDAGIRYFDPEYNRHDPLIAGHGSMFGKVFPGHIFVAVDPGHPLLVHPNETPGVGAVFRNEKGRPMCIRSDCIAHLDAYCTAASSDDLPPALLALDLLHGGDRLNYFLEYCWKPA